ncbi:PREDICTED: low-density lipoprotein receptor-related protein-like, partial [Rhagoletis zephyria]|uniref:low-density lipoprotein receptor-related protein-like n=1 Tax=Rhagoletis zephyria TaxID=28612 RepID=UPI000811AA8E
MGSHVPQSGASTRRAPWNASMIFKVVAMLLILHATCGTDHTATAKQLNNADFTIDDTFDIDQFDETPATNVAAASSNVAVARSTRDLDSQSLLEDELQPVAAEEDADADSWLIQGVKRVRRELSRIFGKAEDKSAKHSHHRRGPGEGGKEAHNKHSKHKAHSAGEGKKHRNKLQLRGKHRAGKLLLQRQQSAQDIEHEAPEHVGTAKQQKKLAKKHSKRQSDYDGSGDGDEDFGAAPMALWRTRFIINEPWKIAYSDQKSTEFLELHRQLEISFRELFHGTHNDEDLDISPTLLAVLPHNDSYKIYVIVQLELPEEVTDFGEVFANQIARYHRLGSLGADTDSRYYFRLVRDISEPIDYEYERENGGEFNAEDNGADGGFGAEEEEDNGVIDEATPAYQYDCDHNPNGQFQCSDGSLIACTEHCNRYPDCADGSDEDADLCGPIYEEEDRRQAEQDARQRAEEEERRRDEEHRRALEAEARRHAEEEDEALRLAEREEDERRRAEEEHRRRLEQLDEERRRVEAEQGESINSVQPTKDDDADELEEEERRRAEQEEEERHRAEQEEQERLRAEQEEEEERRRAEQEEQERRRGEQEEEERRRAEYEERRRAEDERLRAEEEEAERRRAEYESGRDNYNVIQPWQPQPTEEPEDVSHVTPDFDEGSGDNGPGISTDRSTLFTPFGCRGDASFTCSESGVQICDEQRCDDHEDCPDGEDEVGCSEDEPVDGGEGEGDEYEKVCAEYEFKCDERCLPREYLCNGARECLDGSDEANCPTEEEQECLPNEYRCRAGNCIDNARRCDHVRDCPDGDDEDASCLIGCRDDEYLCKNSEQCISSTKVCDRITDCVGGDDEDQCEGSGESGCSYNEFQCDNGQCIPMRELCDNIYDCVDYSDEKDCEVEDIERNIFDEDEIIREYAPHERKPPTTEGPTLEGLDAQEYYLFHSNMYQKANARNPCNDQQFKCGNNVCIPLHLRCDGFYHCNDMTDEYGCDQYNASKRRTTAPPSNLVRTTQAAQVLPWWRTTAATTAAPTTTAGTTTTRSPWIATPTHVVSTVAPSYNNTCLENIEFTCQNGDCIPIESVCDGTADCTRREDEDYNLCTCSSDKWKCLRGGGCIPKTQVCDGKRQCKDGSDESICHFEPDPALSECDIYEFECDYSQCIPIDKRCDGYPDCNDETDEYDCPPFTEHCHDNEFECDQNYCILRDQQCNGVANCNDGTDEQNCTHCRDNAFLCNTGECILPKLRCNGQADCVDASDELNCARPGNARPPPRPPAPAPTKPTRIDCPPLQFRCNGTCVDWSLQCDGKVDCDDEFDERDCDVHENEITLPISNRTCLSYQWQCDNAQCINKDYLCDGHDDCTDGSDETRRQCRKEEAIRHSPEDCSSDQFFCDDECRHGSIRCNGYSDCTDGSDEINCLSYPPTRRPVPIYPCPIHTCPNGKCYSESERCDGSRDCDDGADEANCCAANQFRCRNGDCVSGSAHCNGYRDCRDGSDEEDCSEPNYDVGRTCSVSQFRCNNGQCINAAARCDGYTDCADSSDELSCRVPDTSSNPQLNLKTYPDSQIIKESREVIFRCRDEGPVRARVKWTRPGGRPLPIGSRDNGDGRLEIPNIR